MKIGDKVRFLSEMGGGKVAGFQGKDIVLVEDEDGFEIPMRINDVVVVQSDDYNSRNALTAKMQQAESKQQAMSDGRSIKAMMHAGQEDVANEASAAEFDTVDLDKEITYRAPVEERKGGNLLTACLAFVPVNINEMTTTRFDLYFVNDSNYFINYVMLTADGANWSVFSQGEVEPNTKAYIEEIGKEDLDSLSRVCIQMFAYKREKSFVLKPAIDVQFRIDGVKFYKLHTFTENIYFESPALIYNIVENDQPIRSLVVDAKKLKQEMYKSANADANTNSQADNGNNDGYVRRYDDGKKHGNPFVVKRRGDEDVVVVDLHIDSLLDSTTGMTSADILNYQMTNSVKRLLNIRIRSNSASFSSMVRARACCDVLLSTTYNIVTSTTSIRMPASRNMDMVPHRLRLNNINYQYYALCNTDLLKWQQPFQPSRLLTASTT